MQQTKKVTSKSDAPKINELLVSIRKAKLQVEEHISKGNVGTSPEGKELNNRMRGFARAALQSDDAKKFPFTAAQILSTLGKGLSTLGDHASLAASSRAGDLMLESVSKLKKQITARENAALALFKQTIKEYSVSGEWRFADCDMDLYRGLATTMEIFKTAYGIAYRHKLEKGHSKEKAAKLLQKSKGMGETVQYMAQITSFSKHFESFNEEVVKIVQFPWEVYRN